MPIKFGTSGWRAIIADEFTKENVAKVATGIAGYLHSNGLAKKGVVIGYDTRFLSGEFAKTVADVLSKTGISVLLSSRDVPTPVIAFYIVREKCAGGVNITASHNPAYYSGIKFSSSYGGPAPVEVTSEIETRITQQTYISECATPSTVKQVEMGKAYIRHLHTVIDVSAIRKAHLKIGVDCLYGTARGYLDRFVEGSGCRATVIHSYPDPMFGGKRPEPDAESLFELCSIVKNKKLIAGLATDGDADRFGIVDRDGTLLTANQVICLVLEHLILTRLPKWRKKIKCVARTLATTHMIDAIAQYNGLCVYETPVGFKYIGERLKQGDCILGGEESGGLSIYKHLPEKDGILANLLILEMIAIKRKSPKQILQKLYKKYGTFLTKRVDIYLNPSYSFKVLEKLSGSDVREFAGKKVIKINRIDGVKILLEDNSWAMFRVSGTEPVVRCYYEADSKSGLQKLEQSGRLFIGGNNE